MFRATATIVLMLAAFANASGEAISGVVTDADGNRLANVNITIGGTSYKPTAENGQFNIELPGADGLNITFSHVGFRPVMKEVNPDEALYIILERSTYVADGVTVHASRLDDSNPARPYTDFTSDQINRDYLISEFPLLLENTPNLFSYADAGGGMGYSYLKIRGFDDKRISVYINGVPLNDPEDQATYFVDLPDFAAEVTDIQIERGIGNSSYGDASFGGSVNIVSAALDRPRKVSLSAGYGSYLHDGAVIGDVRKQAFEYSSGLIDGRWSFAGRYSKMFSDGYRENSWYDGWSYFLSVSRLDPNMTTTFNTYGGPMQMHLAYYGSDRATLDADRRDNYLTYPNETDNFNQPHYEIHNAYHLNERMTLSNTLYYIRGRGYYEQYKESRDFEEYNIPPIIYEDTNGSPSAAYGGGDLVRQQWVVKNQYGLNPRLDIKHDSGEFSVGGAFYLFDSEHWGQVVWAEGVTSDMISPRHKYYEYFGDRFSGSIYASERYDLTDKFNLNASLQARFIQQTFDQTLMGAFVSDNDYDLNWLFLSPRAAISYKPDNRFTFSVSAAVSSRTPDDASIYDANDPYAVPSLGIKPERVYDFELGGSFRTGVANAGVNLYWMEFGNEIIPAGGYTDDEVPLTINASRSVHAGIETTAGYKPLDFLSLSGNLSVTYDRARDFKVSQILYDNSSDWNQLGTVTVDYSDNPLQGFPTYLGNILTDLQFDRYRLALRSKFAGRQYIDNAGIKAISVGPFVTFSASASAALINPAGVGRLLLSGRVDNIFNRKYETSGFYESYTFRDSPAIAGAYYIPAAETSFFVQLKLELE
ncbi:MAG: TonB-dependent receptor [Candidatus Zixiibacteriota bacterium]